MALSSNTLAAIDTGTTLIGGPHEDVVSFYASIPGSVDMSTLTGFSNQAGFFAFRMYYVTVPRSTFFHPR